MAGNGTSLIQLQGVKKVFYTDEVETHALADVHLDTRAGEYVPTAGPSGCGTTTGSLDSTNGGAVMELLRELHRNGATICMVTHDPRYAAHADRSVQLFDGRVVEEQVSGAGGEVSGNPEPVSRRPTPGT